MYDVHASQWMQLVYYIMQATPFAHLNLTGYACQKLQVSFAVGNIAGISEFSPTVTIQVNMS